MKSQWIEYSHGDTKLKAYMAYDDKVTGRRPAVLMIHAREGMTPKSQELAETWAKVAVIGYCFGGFGAVEFGSTGAPLAANVSIHGSFRDHAAGWAKTAKGRFLILHGAEDPGFPLPVVDKVVQELRGAKVPFQLEVYSGTGHGFSTPKNKAEERANAQSIASTTRTLKELFGI